MERKKDKNQANQKSQAIFNGCTMDHLISILQLPNAHWHGGQRKLRFTTFWIGYLFINDSSLYA